MITPIIFIQGEVSFLLAAMVFSADFILRPSTHDSQQLYLYFLCVGTEAIALGANLPLVSSGRLHIKASIVEFF